MIASIPLLVIVVIAYNVLALVTATPIADPALGFMLPSGQRFSLSIGELLVALGLVLLYLEIFKATRTGVGSIIDHLLSVALFVICLIEFLLLPAMAGASFAIIMLMTLIDVVAGFTVTISAARRDFGVDSSLR